MHFVLLTWNPGPTDDHAWSSQQWNDEMVAPHLSGNTVRTTWSVGRHVNNIEPGDTAFMYRQGSLERGVVARGIIRSHPWEGPHWEDEKKVTHYVDVEWQECVPVDELMDLDFLEDLLPGFAWRQVYASGRQLPATAGRKLDLAWDKYVNTEYTRAVCALKTSDVWRNYLAAEEMSA